MNSKKDSNKPATPAWLPFIVSFVIPIFILLRFSDESSLGPVWSLVLALSFPIGYEIYNILRGNKPSLLSAIAIGGILVTGAVTLLGLSEGWLAVRRSVPYLAAGMALIISILLKHPILNWLLDKMLDTDKIHAAAKENRVSKEVGQVITRAGYMMGALLILVGIASYILTVVYISAEPSTALFNQEYAKLRLLTFPAILLPLIIGITFILYYLVVKIEKLTGLTTDELLKKK